MTRAKWFLALAGGLLGTAVALSAPPPHHPMPAGGARPAPRPVAHPMPVTRPAPVVTRPGPVVSNARPGVIHPQPAVTRSPLTGSLPGVSGVQAGALTRKPLLTNPHPTATTVRPAASAARNSAAFHSSGVAALAASSGKSPAEVALFLASQRHYDPWGGWGGYGWGGYGWGGYGWGGGGWGGWGFSPFGLFPSYGPGLGVGIGYRSGPWAFGLGYNFGYSPAIAYAPVYVEQPVVVGEPAPPLLPVPELPPPAAPDKPAAAPETNFAERGQELFLAGKYADAVKALRHAVLDEPTNGPLLALTGEALWANGNYNEAAGALQQSLLATPEADWPAVAERAARLIPGEAVGALGRAIADKDLPELRFLAAYQSFGAGKYDEAAGHLDRLLKNAANDAVAKKLREQAAKLGAGK